MGEIAEMMLDGFLDEETGEVIDFTSPGYPRRMSEMRPGPVGADPSPRNSPCPMCKRKFRGSAGLAAHRMTKNH